MGAARRVHPPRRARLWRGAARLAGPSAPRGGREMGEQLQAVTLRSGEQVPTLGQGTWYMGEDRRRAAEEAAALRLGIDLGMTLIDTAEMYGSGGAEEVVAHAAEGMRDQLFIVSKVYPHNASRAGVVAACERSLKPLPTDRLGLSLLHCRRSIPLTA